MPRLFLTSREQKENKKMPRAGIEPATRGFSVLCSTNWAIWAFGLWTVVYHRPIIAYWLFECKQFLRFLRKNKIMKNFLLPKMTVDKYADLFYEIFLMRGQMSFGDWHDG